MLLYIQKGGDGVAKKKKKAKIKKMIIEIIIEILTGLITGSLLLAIEHLLSK